VLVDSHSILNEWISHFCQSLNVRRVSDAKQAEIQTGKQLLALRFIWLLKRYKWPGTNQIPAEDKEYILRYINISSCI
jgi:hypothetical protein